MAHAPPQCRACAAMRTRHVAAMKQSHTRTTMAFSRHRRARRSPRRNRKQPSRYEGEVEDIGIWRHASGVFARRTQRSAGGHARASSPVWNTRSGAPANMAAAKAQARYAPVDPLALLSRRAAAAAPRPCRVRRLFAVRALRESLRIRTRKARKAPSAEHSLYRAFARSRQMPGTPAQHSAAA